MLKGALRLVATFVIYLILIGPLSGLMEAAGSAFGLSGTWAVVIPAALVAVATWQLVGPGLGIADAAALIVAAGVLLAGLTGSAEAVAFEALKSAYGVGLGVVVGILLGRGGSK